MSEQLDDSSSDSSVSSPGRTGDNRIYLKNASFEQMEPFLVEDNGEELLIICHVSDDSQYTAMITAQAMDGLIEDSSSEEDGHYLGACEAPVEGDDVIYVDDPVYETDGYVCADLTGDELYQCLKQHDQNITIEL